MERRGSKTGKQSLLAALNRFVTAVDNMDDIVMIPSKLRDLEGTLPVVPSPVTPGAAASDSQTAVALPPAANGSQQPPQDLYRCFSMLHAIRDEIITGSRLEDEEGEEDQKGEGDAEVAARSTAQTFRYHIQGLFSLLHQLTHTAQYLGSRYETDATQTQAALKWST